MKSPNFSLLKRRGGVCVLMEQTALQLRPPQSLARDRSQSQSHHLSIFTQLAFPFSLSLFHTLFHSLKAIQLGLSLSVFLTHSLSLSSLAY